jgi:ABC-2 type transport system permease protein
MRHFLTILAHEVRMLLVSPSTYIAAVGFLSVMGFIFTGILEAYSKAPQELSPASVFFEIYYFPAIFMVPLLTMKCLADERRLGTIETLLTTPVTTAEVVLGKYAAAYLLYLLFWGSTAGFFYILKRFAGDAHLIDPGPILGGYLFVAVSGLLFIAIGVFASSLSRNQAVAGMLCVTMLVGLHLRRAVPRQRLLAGPRGPVAAQGGRGLRPGPAALPGLHARRGRHARAALLRQRDGPRAHLQHPLRRDQAAPQLANRAAK